MIAGDLEYIQSRLREAREGIQEGELLLEHGWLRAAVSRLYYACFHATEALLWTENLHSTKHSGIRSLFERHWILAGRLPKEMGQFYRELLDNRHHGDYEIADFERELRAAIENLRKPPKLVVTDSQAFLKVAADTPREVPMTSFSILFSRFRGDLITQI